MAKRKQEKLIEQSDIEKVTATQDPDVTELAEAVSPEIASPSAGVVENALANVAVANDELLTDASADSVGEETLADRVKVVSPLKLVFKRFFRSRLSVVGLSIFLAVLVFSFLGPAFVPWGESEIDRSESYRIYYSNIRYPTKDEAGNEFDYYTISSNRPESLNAHAPAWTYGYRNNGDKALHVLGTDRDGYDILVRLMYGGRLSLMLSFLVVLIYTVIGIILGGLAGYFGGWVDMVIMRIVDILNCIPSMPILLIVGAIFSGSGLPDGMRIYIMMGALTLLSWPGTCRLVRGQILFLREQEYMVAADALGFGVGRKIFKHLVPNVMPQLIVSMTLGLGGTILTEASLSYLGLGAPKAVASLGQMVSLATQSTTIMEFYVLDWLPAGLIIILAVVAFNFIGDGLRDALDPKMKR